MDQKAATPAPTDWDQYYKQTSFFSRFTRPAISGALIKALRQYAIATPSIAELGGAGSCALEVVYRVIRPSEYHIVDANQVGLELLGHKARARRNLKLHAFDERGLVVVSARPIIVLQRARQAQDGVQIGLLAG